MSLLSAIRHCLADMRRRRLAPTYVGLTRHAWQSVQAEYCVERGLPKNRSPSSYRVFGLPVARHPGVMGDFIAHADGLELIGDVAPPPAAQCADENPQAAEAAHALCAAEMQSSRAD